MHNDINLKNKSNKAISLEHLALSLTEDFKKVSLLAGFNLPENAITTESLSAPHIPPTLPEGKMGVYVFIFNNHCLKVGKVGPESGNRYRHQHYNPKSSNSNLAKSLLMEQDKIGIDNLTENDVGYWIKDHTDRLNFIMNNCRVSIDWMSYNYLKSQYLLAGCKCEILEFLQPDQEQSR